MSMIRGARHSTTHWTLARELISTMWKAIWNSPAGMMAGIVLGAIIGLYVKPLAQLLAPLGQIYVSLLTMCVLPIMITSIISGLAKLMRTAEIREHIGPLTLYVLVGLIVPSVLGIVVAMITEPGAHLGKPILSTLGTLVLESEVKPDQPAGLMPFLVRIVPRNIFASLSQGDIVSIMFACILVGLALGLVQRQGATESVQFFDVISDSFKLIFHWVLQLLPLGLCLSLAGQLVSLSLDVLGTLIKFVITFYLVSLLLAVLYAMVLWRVSGGTFWGTLRALGRPLILAYMVDSSFIALSTSLEVLERRLGVDKRFADLMLPFGFVANRHGKICLFAFSTMFLAQVHGVELGMDALLIVMMASSLVGMAALGSGVVLAPSLVLVLQAVAVPSVLAPILLTAAGPIIDRMQSAVTVLANCTLTVMIARPKATVGCVAKDNAMESIHPEAD